MLEISFLAIPMAEKQFKEEDSVQNAFFPQKLAGNKELTWVRIKKVEFMENVRALAFVNFTSFTEDNEDYKELRLNQ